MAVIRAHADNPNLPEIGKAVIKAVERHAQDVRFSDDLTILLARRTETRDSGSGTRDSWDDVPPIPVTTDPGLDVDAVALPESRTPLASPKPAELAPGEGGNPESRTPPPAPRS